MKIVVIGGTGLIGGKVVQRLRAQAHDVLAASPASGVDAYTGQGLADALAGAAAVVDLANAPSFADADVLDFFQTAGRHLQQAAAAAAVRHHVALSVVGADRLPDSGYLRGKLAQEALLKDAGRDYTLLRSTQFFEFLGGIVQAAEQAGRIHLAPVSVQPIAADDVADAVVAAVLRVPANATIEIAGPQRVQLDALAREFLRVSGDTRTVQSDPQATYFGARLQADSLVPFGEAWLGRLDFRAWWARQPVRLPA
ncbi:SDR family oxidoreductase [Stenotrophomonas sp. 24(2023)]|uniref:SDR family oxidoreductase n=1 Tax=Stenotrophomonas sp. 24(2023) TaxID=3068324 RepID=UPI0027DF114A|nr:SDR family oxidoreductase [Stenotrophomonas sp. 24(2023)]WMJ68246.1 SDR family oxidoreductase [Stenotrophomonas sp. 24(2023)]